MVRKGVGVAWWGEVTASDDGEKRRKVVRWSRVEWFI
jgi:hypothetical protein